MNPRPLLSRRRRVAWLSVAVPIMATMMSTIGRSGAPRLPDHVSALYHVETRQGSRLVAIGVGGLVTCLDPDSLEVRQAVLWKKCGPSQEVAGPDLPIVESSLGVSGLEIFAWSRRGCALHRIDPATCTVRRQRLDSGPLGLGQAAFVSPDRTAIASAERKGIYIAPLALEAPVAPQPRFVRLPDAPSTLVRVRGGVAVGFHHSTLAAGRVSVNGGLPLLGILGDDGAFVSVLDVRPSEGLRPTAGYLHVTPTRVECAPPPPTIGRGRSAVEALVALSEDRMAAVVDVPRRAGSARQVALVVEKRADGWRCSSDGVESSLLSVAPRGAPPRVVLVPASDTMTHLAADGTLGPSIPLGGHPVTSLVLEDKLILGLTRRASGRRFSTASGATYIARWGLPASTMSGDVGLICLRPAAGGHWAVAGRSTDDRCDSPMALAYVSDGDVLYVACREGAATRIEQRSARQLCADGSP